MGIGQLIKEFRIKNKLTQTAFGKIVGVNKQTISKWENGITQPSTQKIFEISQAIGISASSILKIDISSEEEKPFVTTNKNKYNIGLNSLYNFVHDFKSFCQFVDSLMLAHQLLEPDSEVVGFLLLDTTINDKDSHKNAIAINYINCDYENIIINTPNCTLGFTEELVSHIECMDSFNNETYAFNVYMVNDMFLQLILGFYND